MIESQRKPLLFYGWWVVIAVSVGNLLIYLGASQGSLSAFYRALVTEFGWSRGSVATIGSLLLTIQAFFVYFIGAACDRFGPRRICIIGIISAVAGFLTASVANRLSLFYGFSFFLAVAESSLGFVPMQVLISHWFSKRRGLASGVATAGLSLGGILGPILTTAIIESYSWRVAFLGFGVGCLAIATPLLIWLVRNRPEEMNLWPDGEAEPEIDPSQDKKQAEMLAEGLGPSDALRTPTFWTLTLASSGIFYAIYGISAHWVLLITDQGQTAAAAARLLTIYYSLSVAGRFVWGPLFDRFSSKGVGLVLTAIMATMVAVLTFGSTASAVPLLYAVIFGFCYGGFIFMKPLLVAEYFGTRHLGKVLGMSAAISAFLSSWSPAITGYLFDRTQSYQLPFIVATAIAFLAVLMMATVKNELSVRRARSEAVSPV